MNRLIFNRKRASGFTMIELMISLLVGGFILAGVTFTYLGMKVTNSDTMDLGELQESGRLAMDMLKRDIELAGFWGNYSMNPSADTLAGVLPSAPANDCFSGQNNATFPAVSPSEFKVLFSAEANSGNMMNCITNVFENTDVLQVKRVFGQDSSGEISNTNHHYFVSTPQSAEIVKGTGAVIATGTNEHVWEYVHNVYFIENQNYTLNNKSITVPTLRRMRLNNNRMVSETVMEGVENMRFIFGLDTDGDMRVDTYRTTAQMSDSDWDQQSSVVKTVQIFLLVRTLEENKAKTSQTFVLGGETDASRRTLEFTDGYRRKMFTSTIRLINTGADQWSI